MYGESQVWYLADGCDPSTEPMDWCEKLGEMLNF